MKKATVIMAGIFLLFGCFFLLKPTPVQAGNKSYCKLYGYAFYQPSNRDNRNKSAKRQKCDRVTVTKVGERQTWKSGTNFRAKWEAKDVDVPQEGEITYMITAYKGRLNETIYVTVTPQDGGRASKCPDITITD